ncbi:hypothetical protein P152DRAFT_478681 [Eremomyces bilateralis CBS 781.70]|uniref:BAG domain-containing protein n=1 Tax=Eremomyces bilateralis CBS 781.70 TaxID=1392243 RepID=A0A6G1GDI1_9PEZI|nr:uncharacterized protein P152DRAFT_478681 [Eremomyces bilateralis CBS 781.70]KAF1816098.1 hypothetical protein P152DRAFT_478681 [Eremomyces bilateralis CBS 781.70]
MTLVITVEEAESERAEVTGEMEAEGMQAEKMEEGVTEVGEAKGVPSSPFIFKPDGSLAWSTTLRSTVRSAREISANLVRNIPDEVLAVLPEQLRGILKEPAQPPSTLSRLLESVYDPTTLISIFLLFLTIVLLHRHLFPHSKMSWSSRLPSWGSRFSPFSRSPVSPVSPAEVSESDYSYITASDIDRPTTHTTSTHTHHHHHHHHHRSPPFGDPPQEVPGGSHTDVLLLKHRSVAYPVHYPRDTIASGHLLVGDIRSMAAKKLSTSPAASTAASPIDPRRINLLYRGQKLTNDDLPARDAGFRSGVDRSNEILVLLSGRPGNDGASDDDASITASDADATSAASSPNASKKKPRKKRGKKAAAKARPSDAASGASTPASSSSIPPAPPFPPASDPAGQLAALTQHFRQALVPSAERFLSAPPADAAARRFDHKRITETILQQVLLKLDAVEVDGREDLRAMRKGLVKEVQGWFGRLDDVVKE